METLKNKKYLGIAGAGMLFFSVFFPFIKWKKEYSGLLSTLKFDAFIKSWGGWLLLLMSVASLMIIFRKVVEEKLPQIYNTGFGSTVKGWGEKGLFAPIGISAFILFLVLVNNSLFYTVKVWGKTYSIKDETTVGVGFWFALIGIALLIAHSIIYKGEEGTTSAAPVNTMPQQPVQPQQPVVPTTNTFTETAYQQPTAPVEQPAAPVEQPAAPVENTDVNNTQM